MLQNLKISSKLNINKNKIQEIGTDHLGLVFVKYLNLNNCSDKYSQSILLKKHAKKIKVLKY